MKIENFNIILIFCFYCFSFCEDKAMNGNNSNYWPQKRSDILIEDPGFEEKCPNGIGCYCETDNDCNSGKCIKTPKVVYCAPVEGIKIPNLVGVDQFGNEVSLYDFSHQGKLIAIEMAAAWCQPCNELSAWVTSNDMEVTKNRWWKSEYSIIRDLIHNNEIYFITIQYEDFFKNNASKASVYEWYNDYPDNKIPVIADLEKKMHSWVKPTGIPLVFVVDEFMEIVAYTNRGLNIGFDKLVELYK